MPVYLFSHMYRFDVCGVTGVTSADSSGQFDQLTNSMNDLLLAGCLCDLDLVPWLVQRLTTTLKSLAAEFNTFVPENLYLPAPPVYCPQPTPTNEVRRSRVHYPDTPTDLM